MGLTREREGRTGRGGRTASVALIGNPNVGKSTVFNALTGLSRHTGNWTGKTVDSAAGFMRGADGVELIDLPGCYSLDASSPEEEIARGALLSGEADAVVIVCDASALARNLNLVLQTLTVTDKAVVCVNLIDEAAKRGVRVDAKALSEALGVPVVLTNASSGKGLDGLKKTIINTLSADSGNDKGRSPMDEGDTADIAVPRWDEAERIAKAVTERDTDFSTARRLKLDRFLTGRFTSKLVMLILLALVFFITMVGANKPSEWLDALGGGLLSAARSGLTRLGLSDAVVGAVCDGMLQTLVTVVSVMLPPMAIFFPLFTLLEDLGLLPRIAFNMDRSFCRCGSCGKQALTLCMGFGCNAAGVVGCRIIESPRERMIAILTNSLVPCNGRFPALTAIITLFIAAGGGVLAGLLHAGVLTAAILLGVFMTLLVSKLLSITLLRGRPSSFVLELPPFRRPRIGRVIVRSMLDRTLFVLGRAVAVALPAGLVIWLLRYFGLLGALVAALEPIGRLLGVDGQVLLAYALGLPANELVMPLLVTLYGGTGEGLAVLAANGWTVRTAVMMLILMLFHSPCATTLLTIKKETRSLRWTFLAFLIPTVIGAALCVIVNAVWSLFP